MVLRVYFSRQSMFLCLSVKALPALPSQTTSPTLLFQKIPAAALVLGSLPPTLNFALKNREKSTASFRTDVGLPLTLAYTGFGMQIAQVQV